MGIKPIRKSQHLGGTKLDTKAASLAAVPIDVHHSSVLTSSGCCWRLRHCHPKRRGISPNVLGLSVRIPSSPPTLCTLVPDLDCGIAKHQTILVSGTFTSTRPEWRRSPNGQSMPGLLTADHGALLLILQDIVASRGFFAPSLATAKLFGPLCQQRGS
jgi:hypothetical protein